MKLPGNTAYGETLTNKAIHLDVVYCPGKDTSKLGKDKLFKKMIEVVPDVYEGVESEKR
jgi:hypothetical protein